MGIFSIKSWKNLPSTETPINAAALENLEARITEAVENGSIVPKKSFIIPASFALQGAVALSSSLAVPIFFAPEKSGTEAKLIACRYQIESGTAAKFRLSRNGAEVAGFGTAGSPLSATPTAATTEPTAIALSNNDKLGIVISAVEGSPIGLTITFYLEITC